MSTSSPACTCQLHVDLAQPLRITVGRLGTFDLPAGRYVYTGSAKRNLVARLARHLSKDKKLRWHIDYLLASPPGPHCAGQHEPPARMPMNQLTRGDIPALGFGASDCRAGCGSHPKLL